MRAIQGSSLIAHTTPLCIFSRPTAHCWALKDYGNAIVVTRKRYPGVYNAVSVPGPTEPHPNPTQGATRPTVRGLLGS